MPADLLAQRSTGLRQHELSHRFKHAVVQQIPQLKKKKQFLMIRRCATYVIVSPKEFASVRSFLKSSNLASLEWRTGRCPFRRVDLVKDTEKCGRKPAGTRTRVASVLAEALDRRKTISNSTGFDRLRWHLDRFAFAVSQ